MLPAEAGLTSARSASPRAATRGRSRSRGCTTAVARTAACACCELDAGDLPAYDAELELDGKVVGRVTSAAQDNGSVVALAYVRREVPGDAVLTLERTRRARARLICSQRLTVPVARPGDGALTLR